MNTIKAFAVVAVAGFSFASQAMDISGMDLITTGGGTNPPAEVTEPTK